MQSRKSSKVSTARAEILDLIDALRSNNHTALQASAGYPIRPLSRAHQRTEQSRPAVENYGKLVDRVHELKRQVQARTPRPSSLPLIRGLEQRLMLLEERVYAPKPSTKPPPDSNSGIHTKLDDGEWTFSGVIQGQMLSDMLQLVSSNSMSGLFVVEGDGTRCELYFDEGRMCHAASKDLEGEQAFFSAFGFEQGRYRFRETTQLPEARTINSSTQFLILEALRQIDEARGG